MLSRSSFGFAEMPVTYVIDTERNLIHTNCSGVVTLAEVIDHFRALRDDPVCTGHLDVVLDVRDSNSVPEIWQLRVVTMEVGAVRQKVDFGMCAIIANRDVVFGMMRVFGVFVEQFFRAIRVFRGAEDAEAWLVHSREFNR